MTRACALISLLAAGAACSEDGLGPHPITALELDAYVASSYDASRERFVESAQLLADHYQRVEVGAIDVPSDTDDDLTVDWVYIPAQSSPRKLLLIASGVHGIEAFACSGVQHMFMAEVLPDLDLSTLSVLLVHAVNPWGFRHSRRVSENNVDMNRNFSTSAELFEFDNAGYASINDFLNPSEPVSQEIIDGTGGEIVDEAILQPDPDAFMQWILQGQYDFPLGLYYGGMEPEPQKGPLEAVINDKLEGHDALFVMDLHTGFGERARLHYFGSPQAGTPAAMDAVFEGYDIDTGENNPDFYETLGDFIVYGGQLAEAHDMTYVGMTLEYGTLDSQTLEGSVESLKAVRLENQGFHHGYTDDDAEEVVKALFREAYNPTEAAWHSQIVGDTRDAMPVLINRFIALD